MHKAAGKRFLGGAPALAVLGVPLAGVGLLIGFKLMGINPFAGATLVLLLAALAASYRWSRSHGWPSAVREIAVPAVPAYLIFLSIGWGGLSLGGSGDSWSYGSLALATLAMCGALLVFRMGRRTAQQR